MSFGYLLLRPFAVLIYHTADLIQVIPSQFFVLAKEGDDAADPIVLLTNRWVVPPKHIVKGDFFHCEKSSPHRASLVLFIHALYYSTA